MILSLVILCVCGFTALIGGVVALDIAASLWDE